MKVPEYKVRSPVASVRGPNDNASYEKLRVGDTDAIMFPSTKEFIVTGSAILTVVVTSIKTSSVEIGTVSVFQLSGSDQLTPSPPPSQ